MSVNTRIIRWVFSLERRLARRAGRIPLMPVEEDWGGLSAREAFSHVYQRRLWGGGPGFNSGPGSRDPQIVQPYVAAVEAWAKGLGPMDAVDLGCGDFTVGRQLRPLFGRYVACDVVPDLIADLKAGPDAENVEFHCLDLALDPLPAGDVIFIRQVLQHLPNASIHALIPKLGRYRWLVLTEHLPASSDFPPNRDKPIGPEIRLSEGSGVDLCAEPFLLQAKEQHVLCEVPQFGGLIRTTVYRLRD